MKGWPWAQIDSLSALGQQVSVSLEARGGAGRHLPWSPQQELTSKCGGLCFPENRAVLPSMLMLPWGMWLPGDMGMHFSCYSIILCILAAISPDRP